MRGASLCDGISNTLSSPACKDGEGKPIFHFLHLTFIYSVSWKLGQKDFFFFFNRKGCRVGERGTGINVDVGEGVPNQGFIITTLLDESNHSVSIPPISRLSAAESCGVARLRFPMQLSGRCQNHNKIKNLKTHYDE